MKRLLLALLLVLVAALPAHAAIAHVQTVSCASHAVASCTTPATTTTTGNLFVVSVSWGYTSLTTFTSVTDNKSNTYGNAISWRSDGGAGDQETRHDFIANGAGGASHTFTGTLATAYFISIAATEISGAATTTPLDKTAVGDQFASSHTTASTATTSQANELLIGAGGTYYSANFTCGGTYTERANIPDTGAGDTEGIVVCTRGVTATGAYAFDYTTSAGARTASIISTWKEAAAAAGTRQRCVGCGADGKVIE